jgi:hypothetical protein
MHSEEREDAIPVPAAVFTEHEMRQAISLSMIHTLRLLGLELRQITPDLRAIDHFLRFRYNYWTDDVCMRTDFQLKLCLPVLDAFLISTNS